MDIPHCWSVIPNPLQMPWVWKLRGLMGNHLYSRYFWEQNCEIKKFKIFNGSSMPIQIHLQWMIGRGNQAASCQDNLILTLCLTQSAPKISKSSDPMTKDGK